MIKAILRQYLAKAILIGLIGLLLYGVFPGTSLAIVLVLFVAVRLTSLAAEAFRSPLAAERWEAKHGHPPCAQGQLGVPGPIPESPSPGGPPQASAPEARVSQTTQSFLFPRPKRELAAEALGAVAFAILIPLDIALYARDFFSVRTPQGWEGALVAALCLALYEWPRRRLKSPDWSELRVLWGALPFVVALLALDHAIKTRHAYLNPFNPEHNRLAAERVLALRNNVVAGRHADWVLHYARQLDLRGESQQAIRFYREGLRLDSNDREAAARLARLEAQMSGSSAEKGIPPRTSASAPYWTADKPVTKPPRQRIDSQLEEVEGCTVVVAAVGEVSDQVLDAVGYTLHQELALPVCISPDPVRLSEPTRVRGLVTGPQWKEAAIVAAFTNATQSFPNAPIRYVLVTPVDIYMDDANYVFSASYEWGCVVSSARFGAPQGGENRLCQRTAKQALGALLKSFRVPVSSDRNCVTSYTRSLEEFDRKGNRPNAETLARFQQSVEEINRRWRVQRARL